MPLSRKHYIALAATLKPLHECGDISKRGVERIAHYLDTDNERFDWDKFVDACGIDEVAA